MTNRLRPAVIRLYDEADSRKLKDWVGTPFTGTLMVIMCDGAEELVDYETRAITTLVEGAGGTSSDPIWARPGGTANTSRTRRASFPSRR